MRFARPILMAVIVVALAAYGFDCPAMSTPDEAMQCCDTMPCPSHGPADSQDCCKTMPSMHAPFVQPYPAHRVSVSLVFFGVAPAVSSSQGLDFSTQAHLAAHSHAPPIPRTAPSPLRI
jgi:hypothetical protein